MSTAAEHRPTYADYLKLERDSRDRHEFANGEIFAMSGGTYDHATVSGNAFAELRQALKDRPCRPATSDLRVRTGDDVGAYPDVSVVCGEPRFSDEARDEIVNPTVVVQVLSPSTEKYDRGEKFAHYRTITSLRDYVLVSTSRRSVEVFSREEDGAWTLRIYLDGGAALIPSLETRLEVGSLYDGTTTPA